MGESGRTQAPITVQTPGMAGWLPPTPPYPPAPGTGLSLSGGTSGDEGGMCGEGGTRARSEAAREQPPPTRPGPLRGWAGGKGPGCPAGGTESGCLLSTRLGGGREAFRPTSASQRGAEVGLPPPLYGEATGLPLGPLSRPPARPAASDLEQSPESGIPDPAPQRGPGLSALRARAAPGPPTPPEGATGQQRPRHFPPLQSSPPTAILLVSIAWETFMRQNHQGALFCRHLLSTELPEMCQGLLCQHLLPFDCCRVFQGMSHLDLFIPSPAAGTGVVSNVLVITQKAAMDIFQRIFTLTCSHFSWVKYLRMEWLGCMINV